mmetsp:Transcript_11408/g.23871  ORF Transcript_11408/g.23871 Transcript_11408/m.23871 type:complete len:90 (+) Transcript_11408:38-307(+)
MVKSPRWLEIGPVNSFPKRYKNSTMRFQSRVSAKPSSKSMDFIDKMKASQQTIHNMGVSRRILASHLLLTKVLELAQLTGYTTSQHVIV